MTDEEVAAEQALIAQQQAGTFDPFEHYDGPTMSEAEEAEHAVTPVDLLHPDRYTTRDIRDERYATCKECPRLFKPTRTCRECGCFMAAKTWLTAATCPLDKW